MNNNTQAVIRLLLSNGIITEEKANELSELVKNRGDLSIEEVIVEQEIATDENLGILVADSLELPFISLTKTAIDKKSLQLIPENLALKYQMVCYSQDSESIYIASNNTEAENFLQQLQKKSGKKARLSYATKKDISHALSLYNDNLSQQVQSLIDLAAHDEAKLPQIVDKIITAAYNDKASDIHVEPSETQSLIRFRIDGILHDILHLPKSFHEQIVTRIKVMADMRTDEHLSAQDGKARLKIGNDMLDIRISIVPVIDGEKIVLRLLSSKARNISLSDLGMRDSDKAQVEKTVEKPYGMILSTGPTGSGKTTTIYALLKVINTRDKNIATIEDPVEYGIVGPNQIQVNAKTNLTFAEGLRSILRQDPDIIFVGEIRDEETASIAINAAMTGHLVLSTLHTNNAASTLPRFINMKVEPYMVSSTVSTIIGQRLVRKICESCKVSSVIIEDKKIKKIKDSGGNVASIFVEYCKRNNINRIYQGKGCPVCRNTGYKGRIAIFEVLNVTDTIRDLITQRATADQIEKKAREEGMLPMYEDGFIKIAEGLTTLEEVMRVTTV